MDTSLLSPHNFVEAEAIFNPYNSREPSPDPSQESSKGPQNPCPFPPPSEFHFLLKVQAPT